MGQADILHDEHLYALVNQDIDWAIRLPSDACRESALHGLGHWQRMYPKQVEQIVDSFIAENPAMRSGLRVYADNARSGNVL